MKKILLSVLLFLTIIILTGCKKEEVKDTSYKCCEGCMCGDTLKLMKNYETAWIEISLTKNMDYKFETGSFINFNGTGDSIFAYFKNDDENNLIKELRGTFSVTESGVVLAPNDGSQEITCKLGEEKDLLAILKCDNDFGTFGLQKEGVIELPAIILYTLERTKTIKVNEGNKEKKITKEKEVNKFIDIVKNSNRWTGTITQPGVQYYIYLYDEDNNQIAEIYYTPGHYFTINLNDTNYNLTNIDKNELKQIIK